MLKKTAWTLVLSAAVLSCSTVWARPIDEQLDFASQLMNQGSYADASLIYEEFIKIAPRDNKSLPQAYIGAGDSRFFLKDFDKALEFYKAYESSFPQGKDISFVHLRQGQSYYLVDKFDEALKKLKAVVSTDLPENFRQTYYFYLAQAHAKKGNTQEASAAFQKAVDVKDSGAYTAQAYLQWAIMLARSGDAEGSVDKYIKASKVSDSDEVKLQIQMQQGVSYLQAGQYERASHIFQKIAEGYPSLPVGRNAAVNWFIALFKSGQSQALITEYQGRYQNKLDDPLLFPIHISAVEAYVSLKKYDQALSLIDKVLEIPQLGSQEKNDAVIQKIRILSEKGNYAHALSLIQAQVPSSPGMESSLQLLKGQSYLGLKEYVKAWDTYAAVDKTSDSVGMAYCGMAQVRNEQKEYVKAADLFKECFAKSKDEEYRAEALYSAFVMYQKAELLPKVEETAKLYQKTFPKGEHVAAISFGLSDYYSKGKQYDKALEVLKDLPPNSSTIDQQEAVFQAAYNLQLSGKIKEALNLYGVVLEQSNDASLSIAALKNMLVIYSEQDDADKVAQVLHQIIAGFPSNDLPSKDYVWLVEYWKQKQEAQKILDVLKSVQQHPPEFQREFSQLINTKELMGSLQ